MGKNLHNTVVLFYIAPIKFNIQQISTRFHVGALSPQYT